MKLKINETFKLIIVVIVILSAFQLLNNLQFLFRSKTSKGVITGYEWVDIRSRSGSMDKKRISTVQYTAEEQVIYNRAPEIEYFDNKDGYEMKVYYLKSNPRIIKFDLSNKIFWNIVFISLGIFILERNKSKRNSENQNSEMETYYLVKKIYKNTKFVKPLLIFIIIFVIFKIFSVHMMKTQRISNSSIIQKIETQRNEVKSEKKKFPTLEVNSNIDEMVVTLTGQTFDLDSSDCYIEIYWDNNGTMSTVNKVKDFTATHTYWDKGKYTISLRLLDDNGLLAANDVSVNVK